MDDKELIAHCAAAMGITDYESLTPAELWQRANSESMKLKLNYDPLWIDSQAMDLIKKFRIFIRGSSEESPYKRWELVSPTLRVIRHENLNRAVCMYVADAFPITKESPNVD